MSVALFTFSAADQPAGTKVWDFYTGASIQSSPAIGQHGIVYFGTDTGKLYSFYPDGRGIWEYPTGDRIVGSPAIAADGTVIFGSTDGLLYAVEPGGAEKWRFQANGPIAASPAIGPDGTIVFGSMSKRLFAVRADGSKLWDLESSSPIVGSPAISPHGVVYVAGADGTLAAISIKGDILWQFDAPNSIVSSPAIGADGTVYFGCFDGHVYALSAVGKKLWTYATGGPVKSSPVVGPDGVIYIGSDDKLLYALAPDGFKKWTFSVGAAIRSTPAIASDGTIYVGSYDDALYAISRDGVKQWEFVTDEDVTSSPAIGADGTVYFGSWNGRFYAVKGTAGLASGAWPRFHGNAGQTGFRGSQKITPTPPAPAVDVAANNPVETVKETKPVQRSGNSWWDRVFGPESKTAENRGVIGRSGKRPQQVASAGVKTEEPKVISDARELMDADSTSTVQTTTTTTVVSPEPRPQPAATVEPTTTVVAAAPPVQSGAIPMMTLITKANSSKFAPTPQPAPVKPATPASVPDIPSIPATEPVKVNVPEPVPPTVPKPVAVTPAKPEATMRMSTVPAPGVAAPKQPAVKVPPVSALETPVKQPKAPPAPKSEPVIDRRIPMMRLIESGGLKKTSAVISETGVSTVTFGTAATGVGIQSLTTEVVSSGATLAESSVTEVSAKETIVVNQATPAPKLPKPVSVSAQIREPRYVPGVIKSLITGKKRRGQDPTPPEPEVQDVSIRERNYQPGFIQRLVRPGTRPVEKTQTDAKAKSKAKVDAKVVDDDKKDENSAIVKVETITVEAAAPKVAAATNPEPKMKELASKEPKAAPADTGGLRVISDSAKLFASDGKTTAEPTVISNPVVEVVTVEETKPATAEVPMVKVTEVKPVPPKTPTPKTPKVEKPRVEEKIVAMESKVEEMNAAVADSKRELEELKAAKSSAADEVVERTVANLAPKPEPEVVEPEERILPATDAKTEQALRAVYGDKLGRLESHLISLNSELADARVERARLRKELEAARSGQSVPVVASSAPVAPVKPVIENESGDLPASAPTVAEPRVENVEVVTKPNTAVIPQPEWLKQEVRSVLAAAGEQWEQPPGASAAVPSVPTSAETTSPSFQPVPPTPAPSSSESTTVDSVATIEPADPAASVPDVGAGKPKAPEKVRRPGFLSRLFGRKPKPEEKRMTATNIVVVPPKVTDFPSAQPTDAQLLGKDPTFGLNLVPTNFPRIPYTPDKTGSFIQPGAGNVTQLPGFPRAKPRLVPPPVRDMEPNLRPGPGLRDLNIEETITLVGDEKPRQLPEPSHKPQVVIVSPADNAQLSKPVLDLRGMVKSQRRVAKVLVSVGGGDFLPAAGLDSWSHQTPVSRGLVLVRVKAINVDGVESEIETRTYHYHSRSRMIVKVVGQGSVAPDLNKQELIVGQPYTVTAQPGAGQEFFGWSGAVSGSQPTVSFVMNKDLWLQAEFRPQAAPIAPGRFTGLVHPRSEIRADRSGYIDLQIDAEGNYMGALQLVGVAHPLRGRFDSQWQAAESVMREGAAPIELALRLDRGSNGESLTGYFELAGEQVFIRAFRTLDAGGTLSVIPPGKFRVLMPAPEPGAAGPGGVGFGEATIAADGRLEFSFQLPDGTRAKQSTQLSRKGVWPLYVPLYGGRGVLAGWVSSTDKAEFSLYGEVRWLKPVEGNARGFAVARMIYGQRLAPSSASLQRKTSAALVATAR